MCMPMCIVDVTREVSRLCEAPLGSFASHSPLRDDTVQCALRRLLVMRASKELSGAFICVIRMTCTLLLK
jgi:hypothetical protein